MDDPFEIRTPLRQDKSYDIIRLERGGEFAEGKFIISIVCPLTSNGAMIVLESGQLRELANMAAYLTR